jgi:hypothetical protein
MEVENINGFFGGINKGEPTLKMPSLKLPTITIPMPDVKLPKEFTDWIVAQFPSKAEVKRQIITWSIISAIATAMIISMMKKGK